MNNELKVIFQEKSKEKSKEKKNKIIENISKKLQKIEKLTADFQTLEQKLKTIQTLVDETTTENKNNLCQIKEKFILLLIKKYGMKSFTKWEKEIIENLINEELQIVSNYGYQSETLQNAIDQYIDFQKKNMNTYEKKMAEEYYRQMTDELELDFDNEELIFDKINDPNLNKK
jgi:uncharacterized protein YoxC